jgi:hypothetical protein
MDLNQLLTRVRESHDAWTQLVSGVDRDRMAEPGVAGDWSLKDVVCHISWFEEQMVMLLESHALVGSDWWQLPSDERNALIYEEHKALSLDGALQRAESSHYRMTKALSSLPDDFLKDAANFEGMPADWLPWQIVAQNTYEHYDDHAASVRRWLRG